MKESNESADLVNEKEEYKKVQLIAFKLGKEEYALPIVQVKEIVVAPNVTPVPLTADFMLGVANIRGSIIPIIDLAVKFRLKAGDLITGKGYILVIESKDFQIGFYMREMPNSVSVTENLIDEAPDIIKKDQAEQNHIKGIVKMPNRMIILMDIFKLIQNDINDKLVLS